MLLLLLLGLTRTALADSAVWQEAQKLKLSSSAQWLALLHYPKDPRAPQVSYIDDSDFFLSVDGHREPALELEATLQFFTENPKGLCRYPARYRWLSSVLGFGAPGDPETQCPEYSTWLRDMNATDLVIVFASSYVNSPSSMYGHTFLRFDPPNLGESTPLLSYALNFGAEVDDSDNGFIYAWRGLAGGYPGVFAANPYMTKAKEYTRLENRDLWEYHLDLSTQEVRFVLAHVWELEKVNFDYYFLDENCSYRLLELIEVARPDLDLTHEFDWFAIPIDTVKAVQQAGLIDRTYYRPSNQAVVSAHIRTLTRKEQRLAQRIASGESDINSPEFLALDEPAQNRVAYTAYKFLRYQVNEETRSENIASRSYQLLRFLAGRELGDLADTEPDTPIDPLAGHGTMLLGAYAGADDGSWYTDLEWRLAYHDLLDNIAGYPLDTSLNMGRLVVRQREGDGLQLQRLDLIEITSTPPRDSFYKPLAWRFNTGFERQWTDGDDELVFQLNGGVGLSYMSLFGGRLASFALARAEYNEGFRDGKVDAAGGGALMYLLQGEWINTLLQLESMHFIGGTDRQLLQFQQNYSLTTNQAIRVHVKRSIDDSKGYNEAGIGYRYYF